MKTAINCYLVHTSIITLNGKIMVHDGRCLAGNDETGQVLMVYQNSRGSEVPVEDAEMNSLIFNDRQVIVLKGKVEITVDDFAVGYYGFDSKAAMLEAMDKVYQPLQIMKKVPAEPCGSPTCRNEHWKLEPAFEF